MRTTLNPLRTVRGAIAREDMVVESCVSPRLGAYATALERLSRLWLAEAGRGLGLDAGHTVSLLLCGSREIHRLNARWRGKDKPTDVLSFPLQELKAGQRPAAGALGDIALALPVARRGAAELARPFEEHVQHLLVHGLLHLLGYDHMTGKEARQMEREEERLLGRRVR